MQMFQKLAVTMRPDRAVTPALEPTDPLRSVRHPTSSGGRCKLVDEPPQQIGHPSDVMKERNAALA